LSFPETDLCAESSEFDPYQEYVEDALGVQLERFNPLSADEVPPALLACRSHEELEALWWRAAQPNNEVYPPPEVFWFREEDHILFYQGPEGYTLVAISHRDSEYRSHLDEILGGAGWIFQTSPVKDGLRFSGREVSPRYHAPTAACCCLTSKTSLCSTDEE
jgi:hypothetical protein